MLTIIRGLPGSGKSTKAKELECLHFESDMFFIENGKYIYDPKLIRHAHSWCFNSVCEMLKKGIDVVVSNTFTQKWEFEKYIEFAKEIGESYRVIRCTGNYNNIHNVPEETLRKMKARFENFEGEEII